MGCVSMKFKVLGMDCWFLNHARKSFAAKQRIVRVTVVDRGRYSVTSLIDMACVGDWGYMDNQESLFIM